MSKKRNYKRDLRPEEDGVYFKKVTPKTETQKQYLECLDEGKIILSVGPAGTGKTYLAANVAIQKLLNNDVKRIVLTRPVVEAGEKLGFLPGDLNEKIHPYLLPLLDSIEDHIGPKKMQDFLAERRIEVAPLAYMRGRTFNDSFLILDEAQNTTKDQVKMLLTRLGYGSTFVINGDHSQNDLSKHIEDGLSWAYRKLRADENIMKIEFRKADIVRHPLIGTILSQLEAPDNL